PALRAPLRLPPPAPPAAASALALIARKVESPTAVTNGTLMPLLLLSGLFLPLSLAPQWLRVLAHINPLYYAVEASRDLAVGTIGSATVGQGFLVMGGLAVLAIAWATRVYRKAAA